MDTEPTHLPGGLRKIPATPSVAAPGRAKPKSTASRGIAQSLVLLFMMPIISGIGLGSVQIYLGLGLRALPIFMVSSLALFIYALNRVTDREEDLVNISENADALHRSALTQTA